MKKLLFIVPLAIITVISVFPFYFVFVMSTHTTAEIYKGDIFFPGYAFIENFKTIIHGGFLRYYWNSFYISVLSAALCVLVSALAGFALTKYDFRLKKQLTTFIILTMMVPGQIAMIGYAVQMRHLKLSGTHVPLILIWGASSYAVFFMMQYMKQSVPNEVIESARIDGCNELRIFFEIVTAFIKPAVGSLFMLIFLWSWNSFLLQMIMINKKELFTIPLGIQSLATAYTQDWGARGAALAVSVIPLLIIFAIGSKSFIKGLAAGAVKG
ncbi:carbohydrate ABC transporter permease [Petroclostridium xylanilyticum]|uniref:carbohydrate ABC transporter permease n=1 Tax=Petroclostridium xylanilyticum TaxID=1792311 RepID=UPI000B97F77F|nr:carbohydrate ABC transporter permease [Petroclostridium xylanilyticum]